MILGLQTTKACLRKFSLAAAIGSVLLPQLSQAQSEDSSGLTLEEVVVTAEKRETDLQKTAISIQTYSGEQLQQEGKKRIDEIMRGVVGVTVQDSQVGSSFYMRGVESGGGGPPGGGPNQTAVAVLIDGVYQDRGEVVRGGTLDVSQVEVSRGTQSTNLGASALSGAVSIVSNRPIFEYEASGTLEVGNYNLMNMEGVVNVPLTENQAVRFAYSNNKRDGYISSGAGDSDLENFRLKYRWMPSDNLDMVGTIQRNVIGGNGVSNGVLLATGHWERYPQYDEVILPGYTFAASGCSPSTAGTNNTSEGRDVTQLMGCPIEFVAFADNTYFWERDDPWDDGFPANSFPNSPFRHTVVDNVSFSMDWDLDIGTLTFTPSLSQATFQSSEPPRGSSWMSEDQDQDTRQLDVQLASNPDAPFEWTAGLYYYYTDRTGTFANTFFPGGMGMEADCSAVREGYCYAWDYGEGEQKTTSAYLNTKYPVTEDWRLSAGVRWAKDTKSYLSNTGFIGRPFDNYDPSLAVTGEASWDEVTYSIGTEYDVNDDSMAYVKYQTGYQPGQISANSPDGTEAVTLEQFTAGIKNRFLDNSLQLNLEYFNTLYHDRTLQGGVPNTYLTADADVICPAAPMGAGLDYYVTLYDNGTNNVGCLRYNGNTPTVPDLLSEGVDMEIAWLPTDNDRFDLTVEWLNSVYNSRPELGNTPNPTIADLQNPAALGGSNYSGSEPLITPTDAEAQALIDGFLRTLDTFDGLILQNSSEWSFNFAYEHQFQLANGSTLTPRLAASYKSIYWTQGGGFGRDISSTNDALENGSGRIGPDGSVHTEIQPSHTLYDAFLTWQSADSRFTVTGYVKNIDNEPVAINGGGTYISLAPPRTYGLTLTATIGD